MSLADRIKKHDLKFPNGERLNEKCPDCKIGYLVSEGAGIITRCEFAHTKMPDGKYKCNYVLAAG